MGDRELQQKHHPKHTSLSPTYPACCQLLSCCCFLCCLQVLVRFMFGKAAADKASVEQWRKYQENLIAYYKLVSVTAGGTGTWGSLHLHLLCRTWVAQQNPKRVH